MTTLQVNTQRARKHGAHRIPLYTVLYNNYIVSLQTPKCWCRHTGFGSWVSWQVTSARVTRSHCTAGERTRAAARDYPCGVRRGCRGMRDEGKRKYVLSGKSRNGYIYGIL